MEKGICQQCGDPILGRTRGAMFCLRCIADRKAEGKREWARHYARKKKSARADKAARNAVARQAIRPIIEESLNVAEPTTAYPGSNTKVEVLAARFAAGQALWADGDQEA